MSPRQPANPGVGKAVFGSDPSVTFARETLPDDIVRTITKAILDGRIRPGDRLVERELAEEINVSRGPIRDALSQLAQLGLVEKIPYRGTRVAELNKEQVEELSQLRCAIESLAARLCAQTADGQTLSKLHEIHEKLQDAATRKDQSDLVELDVSFHHQLCLLSGNSLLTEAWENTIQMRLKRFLTLKERHLYARFERVLAWHKRILTSIEQHDPDQAELDMCRHISAAEQRILEGFNEAAP